MQGQRPAQPPDRTGNREDWQQHQQDMQGNRQDYADQAREDRQKYAKNAREDWQEYAEWDEGGHYWVGGWHGVVIHDDDDVQWGTFLAGVVIGTALSSAAYGSMRTETGCTASEVIVNNITYMKCGSTWYNRVMQGGAVNYVVVAAPPGF